MLLIYLKLFLQQIIFFFVILLFRMAYERNTHIITKGVNQ